MLQNRLFAALASRSGFGAAVSEAVARSSIVVADIWEDMKPDEKSSDVKCEGCNVMCEESACVTLHCTGDARRLCSWTTTLQQLCTKHARTGLAGALLLCSSTGKRFMKA